MVDHKHLVGMVGRQAESDALKAFLILSVVLVHLIAAIMPDAYSSVALAIIRLGSTFYFMPLFVAIAGYYFSFTIQKGSPIAVFVNKIAELLLPVCIWYGGYAIISQYDQLTFRSVIWILYYGIYGKVWFLGATFASLMLIVLLRCIARGSRVVFIVSSFILGIALHFVYAPGSWVLEWNYHVPYLFPFAVLGYLSGLRKVSRPLSGVRCWVICGLAYFILSYYAPVNMSHWKTGTCLFSADYSWWEVAWCSLYRDVVAAVGIVFMLPVLRSVWKCLSRFAWLERLTLLVGQNTLAVYILQSFVVEHWIRGMELFQYSFVQEYASLMSWVVIPLGAVLITVALTYACVGLKRIPYLGRVLFGCKLIQYKKTL